MTQWLKQQTAATLKFGPFVDKTDGDTDETALTIQKADVRLSKNGGNMAAASADQGAADAGAPHDEIGYYDISLDTTDTGTLGRLKVMVHKDGALHAWQDFMVVPANVYDSLIGGSDYLETDAMAISGDTDAADNLEAAADGTGYNLGGGDVVAASVTAQVTADVTQISGSSDAADNLEASALGVVAGEAVTGTLTATQFTTDLAEATNDHYNGRVIVFTSGALAGQAKAILDYDGATKALTTRAFTAAPGDGDGFVIV